MVPIDVDDHRNKPFRDQAEIDAAWAEFDRARSFDDDDEEPDEEGFRRPRSDPDDQNKIFLRPAPRPHTANRSYLTNRWDERQRQRTEPSAPSLVTSAPQPLTQVTPARGSRRWKSNEADSSGNGLAQTRSPLGQVTTTSPIIQRSDLGQTSLVGPNLRTHPPKAEATQVASREESSQQNRLQDQLAVRIPASGALARTKQTVPVAQSSTTILNHPPTTSYVSPLRPKEDLIDKGVRFFDAQKASPLKQVMTSSLTTKSPNRNATPKSGPDPTTCSVIRLPTPTQTNAKAARTVHTSLEDEQGKRTEQSIQATETPGFKRPPARTPPRLKLNDQALPPSPSPPLGDCGAPAPQSVLTFAQIVGGHSVINKKSGTSLTKGVTAESAAKVGARE